MRKTLAVVALTASLTGGTAAVATSALAAPAPTSSQVVVAQSENESDGGSSDKTGLFGLLGLLGLAGLVKKKEHTTTHNR